MKETNLNRAVVSYLMLLLQHHDILDEVLGIWLNNIPMDSNYHLSGYDETIFRMISNDSSKRFNDEVAYTLFNSFVSWGWLSANIDRYPKLKMLLEEEKKRADDYGIALYNWCNKELEKLEEITK